MPPADIALPSRTLEELLTFHELEPDESSVVTEGPSDQALLRWFLDEVGLSQIPTYEIGSFDLPAEVVSEHGQENSNRGRVIALARASSALHPRQLVCVVDADLDKILQRATSALLLLVTDYTCLEMYAYNTKTLNKLLTIFRASARRTATDVLRDVTPVLHRLFMASAANVSLGWNMQIVDWTRSAKILSGVLVFDETDFRRRYLQKNSHWKKLDRFDLAITTLSARITGDARHFIGGDDFITALAWYLRQLKPSWRLSGPLLRDALLTALDVEELRHESMFAALVARLNR